MIHATAIIHSNAQIDPTAEVGPYAVIDEHVVLGAGCVVGPHVYLTGDTQIGANNKFHAGCVIGDVPQDLSYKGAPTRVRIGEGNTFREQVTVQRSNKMEQDTVVGSHNYFMANAHVGHNAVLGNNNILANGVLLAGHVIIGDRVFLSGHCLVHQFTRIGTLALMQGGARISKDLPPFTIAPARTNAICGLNIIGMRRAGFTAQQRLEIKSLYHDLFRTKLMRAEALASARITYTGEHAKMMIDFVASAKRGVCHDSGGAAADTADE